MKTPCQTYGTTFTYDGLSRTSERRYPDNERVRYGYDAAGNLTLVSGSGVNYASYASYNALGQPGTVTNGNDAVTAYQYYPQNSRLRNISVSKPVAYANLTYDYFNNGNVKTITDNSSYCILGFGLREW